jgi:hypothetical protein
MVLHINNKLIKFAGFIFDCMARKLERRVLKLYARTRRKLQNRKFNPPAIGARLHLQDINRPLIDDIARRLALETEKTHS